VEYHVISIYASINSAVRQITEALADRGLSLDGLEIAAVRPRIAAVRDGVERLADSGAVSPEVAARMRSLTREAEAQVASPAPQRDRILGVLARLRALVGGLAATTVIVDAAEGLLRTVSVVG
jgi:hypothetical protein